MARISKAQVVAALEALGVEVEINDLRRAGGSLNIHAYAPQGSKFAGNGTHSLSLWDDYVDGADWPAIHREVGLADGCVLEPCTDPDCDVCQQDS